MHYKKKINNWLTYIYRKADNNGYTPTFVALGKLDSNKKKINFFFLMTIYILPTKVETYDDSIEIKSKNYSFFPLSFYILK